MTSIIRSKIAPDPISEMPLSLVRKEHVEQFVARLAAAGTSHSVGEMTMHVLRSTFAEAVENDLIDRNPAHRVLPSGMRPPAETAAFSLAEVQLLGTIPGSGGLMIRLAIFCGLRIGELMALRRHDVRWQDADLIIDESIEEDGGYGPTKTRKVRRAPIPPALLADLREHVYESGLAGDKGRSRTRRSDVALPAHDEAPLFPHRRGGHWDDREACNKYLQRLAGLVGVKGFTSRRCRTTTATLTEGDIADKQALLGHARVEMTLRHYARAVSDRQREMIEALERAATVAKNATVRKRRAG